MPSSASTTSVNDELSRDIEKQPDVAPEEEGPHGSLGSDKDEGSNGDDADAEDEERWRIPPEPETLDTEAEGVAGVINRVLSRVSTKSNWNPGPPPDGGRTAWLCALGAHLSITNTWGFINSFGVFQSYYTTQLGRSASDVSWIGSIQIFLTFFIGTFSGRFTDAGFFRPTLLCGIFFLSLGAFTTSAATQYWQLILSQGICVGIGSGLIFTPSISVVSTYFEKKRSLAIGLTASGSVTGGLVFPAMARQLLSQVGFGWAVRAMAFLQLASMLVANFLMHSRLPPRRSGSLVEWAAFKEPEYVLYAVGMFFNFWAVYFGFYYISSFSRGEITPAMSYTDSLNMVLLVNGIGLIGRVLPNYVADLVGPLNMMIPFCVMTGIALLSWMVVETPGQLYAWTIFFGIAAGAIQSLFPAGLSSLTTDLRKRGTRMGMTFTIASFSVLTGNPIAGAIIGATPGGKYWGAQAFTGVSILVGGCLIFSARYARQRRLKSGWKLKM
ncbi:riboflavin transporter MCH5 [Xylariales sp. PMI_506]|nr:riboflavin transporter MCH5 [Xylariales sp. PMI_506]